MKVFLDNNISPNLAAALRALDTGGHEIFHLRERFDGATADAEWLEVLGKERNWFVISGDIRISRSPVNRAAWEASGLSIIFLHKGYTRLKIWDQSWFFIRWWPDMITTFEKMNKGSGFSLNANGKFTPIISGK